jgi:NADH:ubiquinone oxidoreductase subunit C
MSGYKTLYSYHCIQENKYITEERAQNSPPTQCKNDPNHTIKTNSIYVLRPDYCTFKKDDNIPHLTDITQLNYSTETDPKIKKLIEMCYALYKCANERDLLRLE